jgi:hypothetical protein
MINLLVLLLYVSVVFFLLTSLVTHLMFERS